MDVHEGTRPVLITSIRIEIASALWMVVEAVVGITSGIAAHQVLLTAFGLDSLIELVTGGVLLWRLAVEARGAAPDRIRHAERSAGRIVGYALLALAAYVAWNALRMLIAPSPVSESPIGMALLVASGLLMPYLSRQKIRLGTRLDSRALCADGMCGITCAYMAWTALAGLIASGLGWGIIEVAAAVALDVFIVREALETLEDESEDA